MKAVESKLLEFLKKSPQFVIPIYQRTYSWTERECQQLWDDIVRAGSKETLSAHFIGSIVYIEGGLYQVSSQSQLLVIDGQQRLTTVMLILEVLARHLGDNEPIDGFSAKKLRNYYLLNSLESGDRQYKLLLTQTDKESLLALVQQKPYPANHSYRIKESVDFFTQKINELGENISSLCKGLAKLMIVDIALTRDQDNPQLIFESMNSTGRELSQADLIRNFILMGLEPDRQTQLYTDHWRPMELVFGQEAKDAHFDSFMRHYLTLKTGEIPNIREVYEEFKIYSRTPSVVAIGIEGMVADIQAFALYYCAMALAKETDKELADSFHDIRELKVDVAYPFLLELYQDYKSNLLKRSDFLKAVRLVESYVFRRAICSIPTNSLNKTFALIGRSLNKDCYVESIQAYLLLSPSYRRFPDDAEFMRELKVRDLYSFPRRSYWLRRLENHGRKEYVPVDDYTIEHILPQNENLSTEWKNALGSEWKRIQEKYLHTLGNLTLTGYNSEYSDLPFKEKRDKKGGFKDSPLRLNDGIGALNTWNEDSINNRADKLATFSTSVWLAPTLPLDVLETYKPAKSEQDVYTVADHRHLQEGAKMWELFEKFRKEVLAIDPCVTEVFTKQYVAYKAETNFVDIYPQGQKLKLVLNLEAPEINDPQKKCREIPNSRLNGHLEVGLSSISDLHYVLGLVRQSFEKQMINGNTLD